MVNITILVGDIWKDPEERTTKIEGSSIVILSVVTKEFIKNADGEFITKAEWHTVTAFGDHARYILEKFNKGDTVFVMGKMQTREYIDKDNKKVYIKEIIINRNGIVKKLFNKKKLNENLVFFDDDNLLKDKNKSEEGEGFYADKTSTTKKKDHLEQDDTEDDSEKEELFF